MNGIFDVKTLTDGQFDVVYNVLSFGFACMLATTVFLYISTGRVLPKYRQAITISGTVTLIALYHYWRIFDSFVAASESGKTFNEAYRYVDWLLTVPLMCVEFYLITKKAGAKQSLLWKMIFASVIMLVTGYWGEAGLGNPTLWGTLSAIAYFYIVYEVWMGDVKKLATSSGTAVAQANTALGWFVLVGWAIYPLGYLAGTADGQWYSAFGNLNLNMDIIYNIGDAVNKIGFGLVIYALSRKEA